jgi:hypothetical protein
MGTLHEDHYTFLIISRSIHLRMRNVSDKVVEKVEAHFLCSITVCRQSCHLCYNEEEYSRPRQATDGNMAHAHCIIGNKSHKHILRICNTYSFFSDYISCLIYSKNN